MERSVADRILAGLKKHRDGGGSSSESDGDGERKLYKQTRCGGVIEEVGDDWAYQSESLGLSACCSVVSCYVNALTFFATLSILQRDLIGSEST